MLAQEDLPEASFSKFTHILEQLDKEIEIKVITELRDIDKSFFLSFLVQEVQVTLINMYSTLIINLKITTPINMFRPNV